MEEPQVLSDPTWLGNIVKLNVSIARYGGIHLWSQLLER
jgi:hypothetical protein